MPRHLTPATPRISAARRVFSAAYRMYISRAKAAQMLDALEVRIAAGVATEIDNNVAAELRRRGVDPLLKEQSC